MIFAVAVAINDADARSRPQCGPQIAQQNDGLGDLVIGLQHQHRVNAVRGEPGIVGLAVYGSYVGQMFVAGTLLNVAGCLGINIHGIHHPGRPLAWRRGR